MDKGWDCCFAIVADVGGSPLPPSPAPKERPISTIGSINII